MPDDESEIFPPEPVLPSNAKNFMQAVEDYVTTEAQKAVDGEDSKAGVESNYRWGLLSKQVFTLFERIEALEKKKGK